MGNIRGLSLKMCIFVCNLVTELADFLSRVNLYKLIGFSGGKLGELVVIATNPRENCERERERVP